MNVRKRNAGGVSSSEGAKNTTNSLSISGNVAKPIKNAIGLKPTGGGPAKIKNAVSGPKG